MSSEEILNFDRYNKLSKKIVLNVLRQNLDKLAILQYMNGWTEDDQTVVKYQTIEEQCTAIKNDDVLPQESKTTIDLLDFRRDCSFIQSTIQKTFDEIRSKGTYKGLSVLTNIFKRHQREEEDLFEDTGNKEEEYANLQNAYYMERMEFRRKIDEIMTKNGNLKDEIEDFEQEAGIKSRYLKSWENSKIEMSKYVLTKKEEGLTETIQERQHDFTKEDRVHIEIRNIFNEIEMDFQKQLKRWKIKYEHDFAAINAKIINLKEKKDQVQERTEQMIKKYITRQAEIDSYEEHKMEQERKRLEKENKNRAATKIQAWWRGTMVRKCFGKYKKKKDKKSKKKKENKKK